MSAERAGLFKKLSAKGWVRTLTGAVNDSLLRVLMTVFRSLSWTCFLLAGGALAIAQTGGGSGAGPVSGTGTNNIRFVGRTAPVAAAIPRPARAGLAQWSYAPEYAGQPLSQMLPDRESRAGGRGEPVASGGGLVIGSLPALVSNAFPATVEVPAGAAGAGTVAGGTDAVFSRPGFPALTPLPTMPSVALVAGERGVTATTAAPASVADRAGLARVLPGPISPMGMIFAGEVESVSAPAPVRRKSSVTEGSLPGAVANKVPDEVTVAAALPLNADEWTRAQAKARAEAYRVWQAEQVERVNAGKVVASDATAPAVPKLARGAEAPAAVREAVPATGSGAVAGRRGLRGMDEAMNRAADGGAVAPSGAVGGGSAALPAAAGLGAGLPVGRAQAAPLAAEAVPGTAVAPAGMAVAAGVPAAGQPTRRTMSLDDCLREALQHNFNVQIQRLAPEVSRLNLKATYGAYDPSLGLAYTHFYNKSPGGNDPQGRPIPGNEIEVNSVGPSLRGLLPFGATYEATVDINQREGSFVAASAQYQTAANINLRQPLLRNFLIDTTRRAILINKKDLRISEHALLAELINTVTAVQQAYYELIFTRENVKVQEKSLELAERLLAENKKRVEVGVLAPLDEKQAESQASIRRADLLAARIDLQTRQNALKNLITDDYAQWHLTDLTPAEQMIAARESLEVQESWKKGLTRRPEYLNAKVDLEKQDIHLKFFSNQRYPALDLVGSYGQNGLGGALGRAVWDVRPAGENPRYSAGVILSIPLSNREAKNRYAASKVEKQQSLLRLKKLEQDIMVQIDNSVKQVHIEFERIESARKAREYAEAALEAEQTKLANGKSTSFVVLQLQRDLTGARSAEIRAVTDYNKAVAVLAQNEGTTLERNKLAVEFR